MMNRALFTFLFLLAGCGGNSDAETPVSTDGEIWMSDAKGNRIPQGLHIGWPIPTIAIVNGKETELDQSDRILNMLEKENVEVTIVEYAGENVMYWSRENDECVQKIIHRNSWCNEKSNKLKN